MEAGIATLIRDFGPLIGVIIFFIWRDWKREESLVERVESLERYQQDTLASLTKQNIEVIAVNTQQMQWLSKIVQSCPASRVKNG
jgi:hypothetical protein